MESSASAKLCHLSPPDPKSCAQSAQRRSNKRSRRRKGGKAEFLTSNPHTIPTQGVHHGQREPSATNVLLLINRTSLMHHSSVHPTGTREGLQPHTGCTLLLLICMVTLVLDGSLTSCAKSASNRRCVTISEAREMHAFLMLPCQQSVEERWQPCPQAGDGIHWPCGKGKLGTSMPTTDTCM